MISTATINRVKWAFWLIFNERSKNLNRVELSLTTQFAIFKLWLDDVTTISTLKFGESFKKEEDKIRKINIKYTNTAN